MTEPSTHEEKVVQMLRTLVTWLTKTFENDLGSIPYSDINFILIVQAQSLVQLRATLEVESVASVLKQILEGLENDEDTTPTDILKPN
jgi:hypothetical protein